MQTRSSDQKKLLVNLFPLEPRTPYDPTNSWDILLVSAFHEADRHRWSQHGAISARCSMVIGIAVVHGQLLRDGGLGKSDGGTRQPRHLSLMNPANLFLGATFNLFYGINKPFVTKITTAATAVMFQNMIIRGHSPSFLCMKLVRLHVTDQLLSSTGWNVQGCSEM